MKLGLGIVERGRKALDLEEVAMDREKVRGTERAIVRRDSIVVGRWGVAMGRGWRNGRS